MGRENARLFSDRLNLLERVSNLSEEALRTRNEKIDALTERLAALQGQMEGLKLMLEDANERADRAEVAELTLKEEVRALRGEPDNT